MMDVKEDKVVDASGLSCPMPVVKAAKEMRDPGNATALLGPGRSEKPDGEDRPPDHHREWPNDRHEAHEQLNYVVDEQQHEPADAMRRKHPRRLPEPRDSAARRMLRECDRLF